MTETNKDYVAEALATIKPEIKVDKFVGEKKVIECGTLITYKSEDIVININTVSIKFVILEDSNVKDTGNIKIIHDPNKNNSMIFNLYNMDSVFPEGAPNPFHIANVGGKKIFISFFVTTISKEAGARIFQYTLMEG